MLLCEEQKAEFITVLLIGVSLPDAKFHGFILKLPLEITWYIVFKVGVKRIDKYEVELGLHRPAFSWAVVVGC